MYGHRKTVSRVPHQRHSTSRDNTGLFHLRYRLRAGPVNAGSSEYVACRRRWRAFRALHVRQEFEHLAIVISLVNQERPCAHGASETVDNAGLSRAVIGNSGDLHHDVFRESAGRGRLSEKALQAIGQRRQILTHFHNRRENSGETLMQFRNCIGVFGNIMFYIELDGRRSPGAIEMCANDRCLTPPFRALSHRVTQVGS